MTEGTVDLGGGVTLSPSSEEDIAYVCANLREGDRRERDVFGCDERVGNFERVWTVRDLGETVAFVGYLPFEGEGTLSRRRYLAGLTAEAVWRRRVKYVRRSPDVVNAVLNMMPEWVNEAWTCPLAEYRGAVRWLGRTLGFSEIARTRINGGEHIVMRRARKWQ